MAEQQNRLARDLESRESTQRTKAWSPAQTLPDPTPQKGWKFRWVRVSLLGQADPTNVSAKFREGWEPVKASDHPELMYMAGDSQNPRFKDNIEVGGLVLCKAPEEMVAQRNAYYTRQALGQMEAVDNNLMRQNDPRMPLFKERRSETSFGSGKK